MTKDELMPFCSKEESRYAITMPFTREGKTCFTDGRVLVRVPALPECDGHLDAPTAEGIRALFAQVEPGAVYAPLPEGFKFPEPSRRQCSHCDGLGKYQTCDKCHGDGSVTCPTCFHEESCVPCRGSGKRPGETVCEKCAGEGTWRISVPVTLGNKKVADVYLEKLMKLPGFKVAPEATNELGVLPFVFDDGDGLLMPMRA